MPATCSNCNPESFDIDLVQAALDLEPGHSESFICSGCNRQCIYKDDSGLLYIGYLVGEGIELRVVRIEEM